MIEAKIWYSKKEKMPLKQVVSEKTGNIQNSYAIQFHNFKINLSKTLPNFEKYDTINENKKLKLFSNLYFPIEICKLTYQEVNEKEVTYEIEEAKQMLIQKLEKELKAEIPNTEAIVNQRVNVTEIDGELEVELIYEVLEEIGTKEKILF